MAANKNNSVTMEQLADFFNQQVDSRKTRRPKYDYEDEESKKLNSNLEDYGKRLRYLINELEAINELKKDIHDRNDYKTWKADQQNILNQMVETRKAITDIADDLIDAPKSTSRWTAEAKQLSREFSIQSALLKARDDDKRIESSAQILELEKRRNAALAASKFIEDNKLENQKKGLEYLQKHREEQEKLEEQVELEKQHYDDMVALGASKEFILNDPNASDEDKRLAEIDLKQIKEEIEKTRKSYDNATKKLKKNKEDPKANMLEKLFNSGGETGGLLTKAITEGVKGSDIAMAIGKAVAKAVAVAIDKAAKFASDSVDSAVSVFIQNQAAISARLQGSYLDGQQGAFENIVEHINKSLNTNLIVSQKQLVSDFRKLTDNGIAFNLEERAILSNLSEKMVSTFSVLEPSLTKLIRIQQDDITARQLGAEAWLTQVLNERFNDTSYLTDVYDTVSSALIEANSQMTSDMAVSFNSVVQKWLGAMYSVGLDQSAINQLAQGIGYLASGNVSALSSNSGLQTLLVSAANLGGLSYADMLNNGMSIDDTNKLLESVVQYLKSIDDSMGTNVTKSAMASILGISISDLKAIENLSNTVISDLSSLTSIQNSAQFLNETNAQLNQLTNRMTASEMINNYMENLQFTLGRGMAENNTSYLKYKATQFVTNLVGGGGSGNLFSGIVRAFGGLAQLGEIVDSIGGMGAIKDAIDGTIKDFGFSTWSGRQDLGTPSLQNVINMLNMGTTTTVSRGSWNPAAAVGADAGGGAGGGALGFEISSSMSAMSDAKSALNQQIDNEYNAYKNQSFVDSNYETLSQQAESYAVTSQNIVEGQKLGIKDVNDLYAQLFEQRKAVRISLLDSENDEFFSLLRAIKGQVVDGSVNVDIIDSDVSAVKNAIYSLRSI